MQILPGFVSVIGVHERVRPAHVFVVGAVFVGTAHCLKPSSFEQASPVQLNRI